MSQVHVRVRVMVRVMRRENIEMGGYVNGCSCTPDAVHLPAARVVAVHRGVHWPRHH